MDEKKRNNDQHNVDNESENRTPPTPANESGKDTEPHEHSAGEYDGTKEVQEISKSRRFWGVAITDVLMVLFTFGIFMATWTYTWFARGQWEAMTEQWKVMKSDLEQTENMVSLAKEQAEAARRTAEAAEKTAEVAKQSLEVVERAWVGLKYMQLTKELTPGEKMTIEIVVENTGRTPAKQIRVVRGIRPSNKRLTDKPHFRKSDRPRSIGTILTSGILRGYISTNVLPAETIEKIKKGEILIYVYQAVTYFDVFDRPHETQICGLFTPKKGNREMFEVCDHYNQMN